MIRQCLNALDEKTQQPFELDPHGAADASSRNPLHQQPFDKPTRVIRDEVLLEALDELAPTVAALMVLFAVVNVAIFLVLWGLTLRTHISDDHRLLLTSPKFGTCFWSTVTENQLASITWISLPILQPAAQPLRHGPKRSPSPRGPAGILTTLSPPPAPSRTTPGCMSQARMTRQQANGTVDRQCLVSQNRQCYDIPDQHGIEPTKLRPRIPLHLDRIRMEV